jgi:hypothetical protein
MHATLGKFEFVRDSMTVKRDSKRPNRSTGSASVAIKVVVSGAGVLETSSKRILKTDKAREQISALGKIKIKSAASK